MRSLAEKGCKGVEHGFLEKMAFWNEDFEKADWVRKKMSSSNLCWWGAAAIAELQRKNCPTRGEAKRVKKASNGDEGHEVLCVGRECTLDVAVKIKVVEKKVFGACTREDWDGRRMGSQPVPLGAEWKAVETCACGEKTAGAVERCGKRR